MVAGLAAFGAIQAALFRRERSKGKGDIIDVSLMDAMLNMMVYEVQQAQMDVVGHRAVYPPLRTHGWPCSHRPCDAGAVLQVECSSRSPEWAVDPRFGTLRDRDANWMAMMRQSRDGLRHCLPGKWKLAC